MIQTVHVNRSRLEELVRRAERLAELCEESARMVRPQHRHPHLNEAGVHRGYAREIRALVVPS